MILDQDGLATTRKEKGKNLMGRPIRTGPVQRALTQSIRLYKEQVKVVVVRVRVRVSVRVSVVGEQSL